MAHSPSTLSSTTLQGKPRLRKPFQRKALNCLPCRQQKLKCDRQLPCSSCIRSRREEECRQNPSAPEFAKGNKNARRDQLNQKASQSTGQSTASLPSPPSPDIMLIPNAERILREETCVESQPVIVAPFPLEGNVATQPSLSLPTSESVSNLSMEASYNELHALRGKGASTVPAAIPSSNGMFASSFDTVARQVAAGDLLSSSTLMQHFAAPGIQATRPQEIFWKRQLCHMLPNRNQCDVLLSYYLENLHWMFRSVHEPTLRDEYADFWKTDAENVDLAWLSLLFAILASAALYIPIAVSESIGIPASMIREQAHAWHYGSRQALCVGGNESKPCLVQLQTFNVSVLYWYATKNVDALNLHLAQSIRVAQIIGLDRDYVPSTTLEMEMRHRIWWELCHHDTFQAMCLGRSPMIQCHASKVPIPLNCNDVDMHKFAGLHPRPEDQPTQFSIRMWAARICKLFNRLFIDDSNLLSSFDHVKRVDDDLLVLLEDLPWYCKGQDGEYPSLPTGFEYIMWQHHVLRSYVCTQRIRMFRSFIHLRTEDVWTICIRCAENCLSVSRHMRKVWGEDFRRSPKFAVLGWQIVAVAAAVAAFVIIETGDLHDILTKDLEMAIADLEALDSKAVTVPIAAAVKEALQKVPTSHTQQGSSTTEQPNEFVSPTHSVVGGETAARAYRRWSKSQQRNRTTAMTRGLDTPANEPKLLSPTSDPMLPSQMDSSDALTQQILDSNFDLPAFDNLFTFDSSQWYSLDPFPMAAMNYVG